MIAAPLNDHGCLGPTTELIIREVDYDVGVVCLVVESNFLFELRRRPSNISCALCVQESDDQL